MYSYSNLNIANNKYKTVTIIQMIFGTLEDEIRQRNSYVISCHVIL